MKNIKVLGLAIAASLVATPVFAGETYVRNEWSNTDSYTDTDLHLVSATASVRKEWYASYADKYYVEGKHVTEKDGEYSADGKYRGSEWGTIKDNNPRYNKGGTYDGKTKGDIHLNGNYSGTESTTDSLSVHKSGSVLVGDFTEVIGTLVTGTINTHSKTSSNYHETSAGVR